AAGLGARPHLHGRRQHRRRRSPGRGPASHGRRLHPGHGARGAARGRHRRRPHGRARPLRRARPAHRGRGDRGRGRAWVEGERGAPATVPRSLGAAAAGDEAPKTGSRPAAAKAPTPTEARTFADEAEARLLDLSNDSNRADWVKSTYITDDTERLAAQANQRAIAATVSYAKAATRFDRLRLPDDVARKLKLLKLALTLPAPSDPKEAEELTRIVAGMEGAYGKGKWCRQPDDCLDLNPIERILAESRDPGELRDAWVGWHRIAPPMRKDFTRYVELGNKGARELGYADMGAMWRSKYDMPPDAFAKELD